MKKLSGITFFFTLACLCATVAQAKPRIEPREKWSAVFGESTVKFTFDVNVDEAIDGKVLWKFSANQRTISRGEIKLAAKPNKPAEIIVPLQIPPVKDGVLFRANLTLFVHGANVSEASATFEKPIRIYPRNPFTDRTKWLQDLKLSLFDPQDDTADLFDEAEIPYEKIRSVALLEDVDEGVVMVGEGTSLLDYRSLADVLVDVASKGTSVLVLAPADGSVALPSLSDDDLPIPTQMQWKRQNVIAELDKRLDSQAWPGEKMIMSRFSLDLRRGRIFAAVDESKNGWPWLEMQYAKKDAKLLFCGFGIVRGWEKSPTPRFLFARLLETLTSKQKSETEE